MKKIFSFLTALLFAGSMFATDAAMTKGTNASDVTVNGAAAIKCGTSKADGNLTITVGEGATTLSFYAVAWKGSAGTVTISAPEGVTVTDATLTLKADDAISGSATDFTLSEVDAFACSVSLSGVDADTEITISSGSTRRFVVWGATYEVGEVVVDPWSEITFTEATAAGVFNDSVFAAGDFKLTCVDTDNSKIKTTANNCVFGTSAEDNKTYAYRLQTGGKSGAKNSMSLEIPANGQLRIAVRTGSNSDATRTLVLTQGETELYNDFVTEENIVEGTSEPTVYKYVTVDVKKGTVGVAYPVNGLNFYSFAFKEEEEPAVTYTVAGSNATILGTSWDPANADNDMTKQEDGTYKWEKTGLELSAGSLQFKVCKDHSWDVSYPGENYDLKFDESGVYTVTITFEPENGNNVSAVATKTADLVVLPKVVLHGNFTGSWADTDEFVASEDKKSVSLELTLGEGSFNFGFKFDGSWKANGATIDREHNTTSLSAGDGDMTIVADQAGKYTFVYTFETQTVEVTYPALVDKKTCAEVYSLEKNTEVALNSVVVTGVIGRNVYVRDATAAMLLYFPSNATLNTGDVLSGVTGVVDIYNGIYEVKLNATQVAAIVAVGGAAPEPETITAIDAEKDMSKLVLLEGIELEGEFAEGTMSNINISFAGGTYVLRNQLKNAYVFESGKKYDITALVTLYQSNIQFYFISAQEHQEPAKFYIIGIDSKWDLADVIPSYEDSKVLHLEAGYQEMKVLVDGTWATEKSYKDLTEVAPGLKKNEEYDNIGFYLDEAGDVTVTYTETVFKLEGNFHVDVVPADRRINAWGLNVVSDGESYTFSYNANIDGNEANLVFFKNGEEVGVIEIDAPKKGANEAVVAKEELPAGKDLTWGIELKANPVTEFAKLAEGANLKKCHLAIDNSPESDFFGRMYVANRAGSADGGIYVYNQDYTVNTENTLAGQPKWQSMGRPSVGADGTVYIGDWGDAHGGVYVMNPSTLTATCLFTGTQDGSGVWTNNGVALGSSTASVGVYGEGANTVLYAMNEDVSSAGTTLYKHGVNVYQLGQEDGSVLSTWTVAPTKTFALSDNAAEMFVINATSKGAFFSCSRAKPNNTSGARSLQFYNTNGERTFVALPEGETADLTGSLGGGCAVSRDEDLLAIVDGDGNILVYAIDWNEDTPSLTKITKYETEFAALGSLCFDYAGNIVVTAGTNYNNSTANKLVAYGVPTEDNEILVPAKKALTVSGVATAIEDSFVPVKVEKVIRGGQVLIIKDGKTYNMMGQIVK